MNYSSIPSVPVEIPNINHGLQVAKGLLKVKEDGLHLEFEVKDSIVGLITSGVKSVVVTYVDLENIRFEKGWWNAKIIVEGKSMKVFEALPGSEQGRLKLKVKRSDRDDAQNAVSSARVHLSEQKLKELDDEKTKG
ncbi:hypothetical protein CK503_13925 [Aliifodinibius salipaludis]|uniref:Uncharacterized protein n=1 Tax=Fodinibius salipaludis TaxID=2032627 RepID=A0A2A2G849_9BACT|nr:hypothetical protein [Aliifodinibius salipaludis]PAU93017.1 hypothetical protein CK503_13925 [Aliifodinibius salipaludis]